LNLAAGHGLGFAIAIFSYSRWNGVKTRHVQLNLATARANARWEIWAAGLFLIADQQSKAA
jgi:hypothetical protein